MAGHGDIKMEREQEQKVAADFNSAKLFLRSPIFLLIEFTEVS